MRPGLRLVLAAALLAAPAVAHEARPLHVEVRERAPRSFTVRWRTPGSVPARNRPEVALAGCALERSARAAAAIEERGYRCAEDAPGAVLTVRYPLFNPSVSTLVRFARLSGEQHTAVLGPDRSEWRLPLPETPGGVAREYLGLGMAHILEGADHLLFLACLIFIARSARRILVTVTGFTLAHSVTLALAVLGWVRVPVPPVEASIALSIVFLATEIARDRRDTLTRRFPISVSSSFGLLHGPLRLLVPPVPLQVVSVTPEGPPRWFHYQNRQHRVLRPWGPERIETAWWRGRTVRRDYYRVEDQRGSRFWLFRRLTDGKWFLQGQFD